MPEQKLEALVRVLVRVPLPPVDVLEEPKNEQEAATVEQQRIDAARHAETIVADEVRAAVAEHVGEVESVTIDEVREW